jgi:hypothetical protein
LLRLLPHIPLRIGFSNRYPYIDIQLHSLYSSNRSNIFRPSHMPYNFLLRPH